MDKGNKVQRDNIQNDGKESPMGQISKFELHDSVTCLINFREIRVKKYKYLWMINERRKDIIFSHGNKISILGPDNKVTELGKCVNEVRALCLSKEGKILYSGGWDSTIRMWSLSTNKEIGVLGKLSGYVRALVTSKDGHHIYSGSEDNAITKWNIDTNMEEGVIGKHAAGVRTLVISEDGNTLYSGSSDNSIKYWDLTEQKNDGKTKVGQIKIQKGTNLGTHDNTVNVLCISKKGDVLYSGGNDWTIKIWNLNTKKLIMVLGKNNAEITSLCLSRNNKLLYSGGQDNCIRMWDLRSYREISMVGQHDKSVLSLCLSIDGETLYSGGYDNQLKVWSSKSSLGQIWNVCKPNH